MTALPIIVGMGGINAAGRTSFHQAYRRIVLDKLDQNDRADTFLGLATLMNLVSVDGENLITQDGEVITKADVESKVGDQVIAGTLIRKIEKNHFDVDATHWQQKLTITANTEQGLRFTCRKRDLPTPVPSSWSVEEVDAKTVNVHVPEQLEVKHDSYRDNPIKAAGQLPTGFEPAKMYNSRYQPRGLQATIFAATDAIKSTGLDWENVMSSVKPDEIGTYSASVAGQMDNEGLGGLVRSRLRGDRVSTKQLALGLNTMSTDFINAYVTGSVGTTFSTAGACATFLYNLRAAVNDIQAGRTRVAVVASVECALTPEVIEGFGNMGALANEEGLKKLDNADKVDHRRTSRPFGENCGFTIGEGAQVAILMDDKLALELGAEVMGSVVDVFVNADGVKKSITAPGPGNYITMAKSVALAQEIVGQESLQKRSFILAHGSSTPQNRVTESAIYHKVAEAFSINGWKLAAPKAYVGHTIAPASGDQLAIALGVFSHNIMPGITTIDKVADDVFDEHLDIRNYHYDCGEMDIAFINSKGFGGNNATATVFSPKVTAGLLAKRHGEAVITQYQQKLAKTIESQQTYKQAADLGKYELIYRFGNGMVNESQLTIDQHELQIPGFEEAIKLTGNNQYADISK
ncbi:beta-ketoacyl synthase [Pseudoalteromonas luteoviolacea]|uniref:Beta-ketoacyl synthase n=1 Tax=Pseudoalteromonas luteoviolacea S4054 TaxID=1129367 RepID=A0A0F6AE45_9GAMM|nr:beta-ketoacyl synthase [Pseudoalteromonas luteoviolacea]AOT08021.1 beta-ketoacyl synthase [Pseudoalteromonas luteoviolacea]AOT12938.1 beta-ketoacyl synthase [Pseudoalteromonas luteoviolacea]AOT17850.1 beta-ketoacyl synthase [Pseudoalteromonas luteoviolacea]KKE84428.1 beta-ketoacyl synthase [Pseudoalteromonas luteoviolacea S4054]KZN71803.1 beta-ketoacyl synthase [Pseudoalteromonas luteoviolacea S4047-1]